MSRDNILSLGTSCSLLQHYPQCKYSLCVKLMRYFQNYLSFKRAKVCALLLHASLWCQSQLFRSGSRSNSTILTSTMPGMCGPRFLKTVLFQPSVSIHEVDSLACRGFLDSPLPRFSTAFFW